MHAINYVVDLVPASFSLLLEPKVFIQLAEHGTCAQVSLRGHLARICFLGWVVGMDGRAGIYLCEP